MKVFVESLLNVYLVALAKFGDKNRDTNINDISIYVCS